MGRIPVEENDKRLQVLIMSEKGREAGLTLFTDTLCELTYVISQDDESVT